MVDLEKILKYSKDLTLLYVEDNEDTINYTTTVLSEFFDNIIVATDGLDGLEKCKNNHIDLIISDINMPKMNGLDMVKHIKEKKPDIPVLILSAFNESKYLIDSIHYGVDGYIIKPMQMEQFTQALFKAIENINLKKENIKYKKSLEEKIQTQFKTIEDQEKLLILQSRMACMGEIIDTIAHQWKQPLNIINMSAEIISFEDNEELKQTAQNIVLQVEHMTKTMDEFRKFLRPDTNVEIVSIKNILTSVELLLKDELLQNNVTLKTICHHNVYIKANENDIKHIFINLINNATSEMVRNNLKSEDKIITIECINDENSVIFLVKDNGKGIPEELQDKIFEANFTTKKEIGGTGVGLYMSKRILAKYNGKISVYNKNGAIFKIEMNKP